MSTREESYSGYPLWIAPLTGGPAPTPDTHPNAVRIYADENQDLRSLKSDGTDAPIGGGGAALVHTREQVSGATSISIANSGGAVNLDFSHQRGDALLDYSIPTEPALVDAGLYYVAALPSCDDGTQVSGYFDATLNPLMSDLAGFDDEKMVDLTLGSFPITSLSFLTYFEAGEAFRLSVANHGPGALHFSVNVGLVQRIY